MHRRKLFAAFILVGVLAVVTVALALLLVQPAQAQCGSQASSCKNCHETQGKKPVNNDGTAWHQSHAFGDFCYICHFGNNQATDEVAAHAGMVSPLADVKASCAQCHPNDLQARAQVYADKLSIQIGAGATPAASGATSATAAAPAAPSAAATGGNTPAMPAAAASPATLVPNDPNLVNYVQRYNENVLDQHPANWGNTILLLILAAIVLGAGFLVVRREGWIVISLKETKPLDKELPSDVADMAPEIARLKPAVRRSLQRLLSKPEAAAELLTAIDYLTTSDSTEKNAEEPSDPHHD